MMEEQVPIEAVEALDDVRNSGKCNMFSAQEVFYWAYQSGHYKAVNWLFNEKWTEGSHRPQVDLNKYFKALNILKMKFELLDELQKY